MRYRIGATVIIFLAIIIFPYWVYVPLLLGAMILFPVYWEGIFLGFFIDSLYGGIASPWELFSPAAFAAMAILIGLLPVRERMRIHV